MAFSEEYKQRFGGIGRLYGTDALAKLNAAHVCIMGIGGVGCWVAEALARSGIGQLTLVDLDDLCTTNTNRQLHATTDSIGKQKTAVMAERIKAINPECIVTEKASFYTENTSELLLSDDYDYVVDAFDSFYLKAHLVDECRKRNIPVIVSGGAGGRRDPTLVRVDDLSRSQNNLLLKVVRKRLRQKHGWPRGKTPFDVPCVFSTEDQYFPQSDGSVCEVKEEDSALALDCASGFGTTSMVTGAYGLAMASRVISDLSQEEDG